MKVKHPDELIKNPKVGFSHLVLLGAGASRASFPNGDASGKQLPLMNDLVDILDLKTVLETHGINPNDNFEIIYSQIQDLKLRNLIENKIDEYFSNLGCDKQWNEKLL